MYSGPRAVCCRGDRGDHLARCCLSSWRAVSLEVESPTRLPEAVPRRCRCRRGGLAHTHVRAGTRARARTREQPTACLSLSLSHPLTLASRARPSRERISRVHVSRVSPRGDTTRSTRRASSTSTMSDGRRRSSHIDRARRSRGTLVRRTRGHRTRARTHGRDSHLHSLLARRDSGFLRALRGKIGRRARWFRPASGQGTGGEEGVRRWDRGRGNGSRGPEPTDCGGTPARFQLRAVRETAARSARRSRFPSARRSTAVQSRPRVPDAAPTTRSAGT